MIHTLAISLVEALKFFFDKFLIVYEICASANDTASRFIVLKLVKTNAKNLKNNIWIIFSFSFTAYVVYIIEK